MTKASFQAFCRNYTGTALEAMADAHALCDLQNAASGDIAARLGAISGLPPAVAVQVAWNGTDTDLDTYFNAGVAILRSLGTNAHVWLPGANGVSVASLPSNNYLLSDGSTGYSTVDSVDGLTLDGMGSLGSELNPDPGFDVPATWTKYGSWAVSGGVASTTSESSYMRATLASPLVSGGTYKVQYTISNCSAGGVRIGLGSPEVYSTYSSGNGLVTAFIQPTSTAAILIVSGSTFTGSIDNISVKEYTGTHLTQATTANKPLVRRGMLNLLTYSADQSNAAWTKTNLTIGGSAGACTLVEDGATSVHTVAQTPTITGAATIAAIVKAEGRDFAYLLSLGRTPTDGASVSIAYFDLALGTTTLTLGAASSIVSVGDGYYLCVLNGIASASAAIEFRLGSSTAFGIQSYPGTNGLSAITVASTAIIPGTWTAAQILAEGGIPTTTATAASNASAGKYWWSFDGSNDSLLSGNLGITNACTIVVAGRVNSLAAINYLMGEDTNGFNLYVATSGAVGVGKTGVSNFLTSAAGKVVAGVPFVLTFRLSGGTAVIRKDGVQIATVATALVFAAITGLKIGMDFGAALPTNGALGWVVPLPTALSDADCLTVERLVGSQFPGMATF